MHVVVVGGTGDVGRGIARAAVGRGWRVTVVSRGLSPLPEDLARSDVALFAADVTNSDGVERLVEALDLTSVDAVVIAVNDRQPRRQLTQWPPEELAAAVGAVLEGHLRLLQALVPRLPAGATVLGFGGGMADATVPGYGWASAAQSALRALYRTIQRENKTDVRVIELIIAAIVRGDSNRDDANAHLLGDDVIAEVACGLLATGGTAGAEQAIEASPAILTLTATGELR